MWYIGGLEHTWTDIYKMASVTSTQTATTFYKGKSSGILSTNKSLAEGTYVSGYLTMQVAPKEIDGGRYWRFVYMYNNGVLVDSKDVIF